MELELYLFCKPAGCGWLANFEGVRRERFKSIQPFLIVKQ